MPPGTSRLEGCLAQVPLPALGSEPLLGWTERIWGSLQGSDTTSSSSLEPKGCLSFLLPPQHFPFPSVEPVPTVRPEWQKKKKDNLSGAQVGSNGHRSPGPTSTRRLGSCVPDALSPSCILFWNNRGFSVARGLRAWSGEVGGRAGSPFFCPHACLLSSPSQNHTMSQHAQ